MHSRLVMTALPPDARDFAQELGAVFGERLRLSEPMALHTTFRIGGPADYLVTAQTAGELVKAVELARDFDMPVRVIGSGANLLISDRGMRGLVIINRADTLSFTGKRMTAESGAMLASLVNASIQRGLAGLEWASGIPGTVGGAVVNNAGAHGGCMASCLARAELLFADNSRIWQDCAWFDYKYRSSRLKGSPEVIVLQAEFTLAKGSAKGLKDKTAAYAQQRRDSQPSGATIGSMFKNPPGDYAGRLIEAAGLKGQQIGQALISPKHGNFFINTGQATAADMRRLIDLVQQTVLEKFQIKLELEIELAGDWS